MVATFDAMGASGAPAEDLPAGVLFWRIRGRAGTSTGTAMSATWQFTVGVRSAPVNASWGTTLDVNGDGYADLVVGAQSANRVYLYLGGVGGLSSTPATTLSGPDGGFFGSSVASVGDINSDGYADVVVGAYGVLNYTGRAYIYLGSAGGLATVPATTVNGPALNSHFGYSVASAGDVNGDGYADLVVGARDANRVFLYLGGLGGLSSTPATTLTGPDGGSFGYSVANVGDVNGDGYADLAVGAPFAMGDRGRAYVYLGGAGGLATTHATPTEPQSPRNLGRSVASAGDVNGDGYADLAVGAVGGLGDGPTVGTVYVYLCGPGGLAATPATTLAGPDGAFGWFGTSVAIVGDVHGGGDLVVRSGATGRAYVDLGGPGLGAARLLAGGGPEACRPFDRARHGTQLGEAAVALVLEAEEIAMARGVRALGRVAGYGAAGDGAHHTIAPTRRARASRAPPGQRSPARASPHGTSTSCCSTALERRSTTPRWRAFAALFGATGDRRPASAATKPVTGHCLGARGALETVIALGALARGVVPPTPNLDDPDPSLAVPMSSRGRHTAPRFALVNASGFGGRNAVLVLERA